MTRPADPGIENGATCYRHSKRETNVRCQNCGKPICPECMRDTPVGYRCPDCAPVSRPIFDESMIATKVLLGICFAVYLIQVVVELGNGQGVNAITNTQNNELFQRGVVFAGGVAQGGEWWRIFTSGFLHFGLFHIALNAFFIWSLGQLIETAVGKLQFTLIYVVSLIGGSLGAMAIQSAVQGSAGASGAGFGLLGAALVMARLRRNEALASQLMGLAAINFLFTVVLSGISVGGHVGGFIAGGICGWIAYGPLQRSSKWVVPVVLVVVGIVLFGGALEVAHLKVDAFVSSGVN